MVEEAYVSFETAKLLKEKGFPQSTFRCHYITDGNNHYKSFENRCGFGDFDIIAPTQQIAIKWLREVHQLHIMVNCIGKVNYDPIIQRFDGKDFEVDGVVFGTTKRINGKYVNVRRGFKTYEDACEAAIKYCLENLI